MRHRTSVRIALRSGLIGIIAAAAAHGAAAAPTPARPMPDQPAAPAARAGSAPGSSVANEDLLSVNFPGGTVAEYVQAVKEAAAKASDGRAANVLVPAEAAAVEVPPITLRDVSIQTALEALTWSGAEPPGYQFGIRSFGFTYPSAPPQAFAVHYGRSNMPTIMGGPAAAPASVEVSSIRDLSDVKNGEVIISIDKSTQIRGLLPETILTSVEAALSLAATDDPAPELKYHEESGLLIVRGSPQQVALVKSVLRELRGQADQRAAARKAKEIAESERDYRQKRLQVETQLQNQELDAARAELEAARKSGAPESLLRQLQLNVAKEEAHLRMLELEAGRPIRILDEPPPRDPSAGGDTPDALLKTIDELRDAVAQLRSERKKKEQPHASDR